MEEKNLKKILAFDVVVPEIQREYVWGKNERVINQFLEDLRNQFLEDLTINKRLNIGFVYSYKPYAKLNEIFLIDGQQRITTMVLIAFYCAIKDGKLNEFKNLLKLKLNKTKPAFSYRVRSCTKEFMSELFNRVDNLIDLGKIKEQKWFLDRYRVDISISSMIEAIDCIIKALKDINNLYDFIIKDVTFWYFNVEKTSQGEELYITMNSRGESLSDAEQIKPLLFENIDSSDKQKYGKLWDDIEEYFYKEYFSDSKSSNEGIEIVDLMMDRFIQLILQLENKTEKNIGGASNARFSTAEIQNINLEKIKYYFDALKIIDLNFKEKNETSLLSCFYEVPQKEIFLYPLASLLKAVYLIVEKETTQSHVILSGIQYRELLRLYKVIRNAVRRGTINYVPLLKILYDYKGEDIYKFFLGIEKELQVLSPHELDKIRIISEADSIEDIEEAFWEAQESLDYLLGGSLKPLIEPFRNIENWTYETLDTFKQRKDLFSELFDKEIITIKLSTEPKDDKLDNSVIARALLTIEDYSYHTGASNYCFGYSDYWKLIFKEEKGWKILSKLLTKIEKQHVGTLYERLQKIIQDFISNYNLVKNGRYYLIKYPYALQAVSPGYNILTFWTDWTDYRVEVLSKEMLSSYHVNPYTTAVFKKLEKSTIDKVKNRSDKGDSNTGLIFENGISLKPDSSHSWNVLLPKGFESDKLPNEYKVKVINNDKFYQYEVNIKEDLIEKGIELANQLFKL